MSLWPGRTPSLPSVAVGDLSLPRKSSRLVATSTGSAYATWHAASFASSQVVSGGHADLDHVLRPQGFDRHLELPRAATVCPGRRRVRGWRDEMGGGASSTAIGRLRFGPASPPECDRI